MYTMYYHCTLNPNKEWISKAAGLLINAAQKLIIINSKLIHKTTFTAILGLDAGKTIGEHTAQDVSSKKNLNLI